MYLQVTPVMQNNFTNLQQIKRVRYIRDQFLNTTVVLWFVIISLDKPDYNAVGCELRKSALIPVFKWSEYETKGPSFRQFSNMRQILNPELQIVCLYPKCKQLHDLRQEKRSSINVSAFLASGDYGALLSTGKCRKEAYKNSLFSHRVAMPTKAK